MYYIAETGPSPSNFHNFSLPIRIWSTQLHRSFNPFCLSTPVLPLTGRRAHVRARRALGSRLLFVLAGASTAKQKPSVVRRAGVVRCVNGGVRCFSGRFRVLLASAEDGRGTRRVNEASSEPNLKPTNPKSQGSSNYQGTEPNHENKGFHLHTQLALRSERTSTSFPIGKGFHLQKPCCLLGKTQVFDGSWGPW